MKAELINQLCSKFEEHGYTAIVRGAKAEEAKPSELSKLYNLTAGRYFVIDLTLGCTKGSNGKIQYRAERAAKHTIVVYETGNAQMRDLFKTIEDLIVSKEYKEVGKKDDGKGNVTFDAEINMDIWATFATISTEPYYQTNKGEKLINPVTKTPREASTLTFCILTNETADVAFNREYNRRVKPYLITQHVDDGGVATEEAV